MFALAGQIFWALAPYHLEATAIGFFVRMSIVWSLLGAMLLFADERRLLRMPAFYLGFLLTVSGFLMLAVTKTTGVTTRGVVVMIICSFFFGCYAVSVRYFLKNIHPLVAFGVVAQLVSVGTIAAMFIVGHPDYSRLQPTDWQLMVASAILGVGIGHILLYTAVIRLGPSIAGSVQAVTPFVTAALAMIFLGESMRAIEWVSGCIMFAGATVLVSLRKPDKSPPGVAQRR